MGDGSEFAEVVFLLALVPVGILKPLIVFTLTRFSALFICIHSFILQIFDDPFSVPVTMVSKMSLT